MINPQDVEPLQPMSKPVFKMSFRYRRFTLNLEQSIQEVKKAEELRNL